MVYNAKKVWLGHISIRDYLVQECINKKEDLIIEFNGASKRFPCRSLPTYLNNTYNMTFKSKYGGKDYKLIEFPFTQISY